MEFPTGSSFRCHACYSCIAYQVLINALINAYHVWINFHAKIDLLALCFEESWRVFPM